MNWRYGLYTRWNICSTSHGVGGGEAVAMKMPPKWNTMTAEITPCRHGRGAATRAAPVRAARVRTANSSRNESQLAGVPGTASSAAAAPRPQAYQQVGRSDTA